VLTPTIERRRLVRAERNRARQCGAAQIAIAVRHQPQRRLDRRAGGATSHGGWGASFALRLTSRPRCYSLLFPKNTAGNPALAADFLGFGKNCWQNNSEKQRVKTATFCCKCRETASRIPALSRLMETVKANIIGTGSLYTRWRQFSDRPSRFAQAYFLRCCAWFGCRHGSRHSPSHTTEMAVVLSITVTR
jgi:hypothetical protein